MAPGRPPSNTDVASTDPLPKVATTYTLASRLMPTRQNCMALYRNLPPLGMYRRVMPKSKRNSDMIIDDELARLYADRFAQPIMSRRTVRRSRISEYRKVGLIDQS